ncbi:MAG: 50S ribosomal protein L9 [Candidatus Moraniibacteriota bacterium]
MKVILREAVPKLGKAGDIKEVRMGYGFNFLLPRGLAELATNGNIKRILSLVQRQTKKLEVEASKLSGTVKKLEGKKVTIKMKSRDGKLFGSVGKTLIVEALKEKDIDLIEEVIVLEHPLKKVGEHSVKAKAGEAEATFTVVIAAE